MIAGFLTELRKHTETAVKLQAPVLLQSWWLSSFGFADSARLCWEVESQESCQPRAPDTKVQGRQPYFDDDVTRCAGAVAYPA